MDVDAVVVGAGVVGTAVAAELADAGLRTVLVERHAKAGTETSSRSSEVVHAGLYGAAGSLKAELCVAGNAEIWRLAREQGLAARRTGKLVVATRDEDLPRLEALAARARSNGVPGIELIDGPEATRIEPALRCTAALESPSSGIVDSHALVRHFERRARAAGVDFAFETRVVGLEARSGSGFRVCTEGTAGDLFTLESSIVVNAAGLEADRIASLAGVDIGATEDRIHPVRGRYFALAPALAREIRGLIYPLPPLDGASLGIHVAPDLAGRVRLGPDAGLVARPPLHGAYDFEVDPALAAVFADAVQAFLPQVRAEDLSADQAGIRPALARPGEPKRDFVVREEGAQGLPGLVNLIGIDSPGLTAAPALARHVRALVEGIRS